MYLAAGLIFIGILIVLNGSRLHAVRSRAET
jgi:hypothetical protein